MNTIKAFVVGICMSSGLLQADNHSDALWLMLANRCDQYTIAQYEELTLDNFFVTDEDGKNIYDIALAKHKETRSIPCGRIATFLRNQEQELRKKFEAENAEKLRYLDELEQRFEKPHQ